MLDKDDSPIGELAALLHLASPSLHSSSSSTSNSSSSSTTTTTSNSSNSNNCSSAEEHPHVVPLIEAMADSACVYLIFPYSDGGELFEHVAARPEGLKEDEARRYFRQITLGLRHLKENGLTHGDVSLENVMLSQGRYGRPTEARLIDLEMARKVVVVEEEGGREDLGKEGEGFSGWCDKTEEAVVYTEGGREGGRGRAGRGPRQGQRQKLAGGKPG
eukprot:evm.model.NODE_2124_length_31103_cov_30.407709.2